MTTRDPVGTPSDGSPRRPGAPARAAGSSGAPAAADAPAARRTRAGEVVVGPTVLARAKPGILIGLPLLCILLGSFPAIGVQAWHRHRVRSGHDGWLEMVFSYSIAQFIAGAVLMWVLCSLWALLTFRATRTVVLLDEDSGSLRLMKGFRCAARAGIEEVRGAVGEPQRGGMAVITLEDAGKGADRAIRDWIIPEIGWDDASYDGLRILQDAAELPMAPPRHKLLAAAQRGRLAAMHREYADRLGMRWDPRYEEDPAAFEREFDRVRRVLAGRESPRNGDPAP